HASRNPFHRRQHFFPMNALSVTISEGVRQTRARGRNCRKTRLVEDPGAGAIPCVWQDQNIRAVVESPQQLRFLGLLYHGFHYIYGWHCSKKNESRQPAARHALMYHGTLI